jgi:MFS family permease
MSIFGATLTAGMALGLILGGLLTSGLGWRWCLYINVVVCLIAVPAALRVLPSIGPRPAVHLDPASALMCALGMVGLVYGLGEATSSGWGSAQVVGSLLLAGVAFTAFVARQARLPHGLLPLRVVRDRTRGGAMLAMVINGLSTVGMMLILTFQLQTVLRYSPLRTGLILTPFALAAAWGSIVLARRLMTRVAPRWLIGAGIVLSAAGLLPLLGLTPGGHQIGLIFTAEVIEGIGSGLAGPVILASSLRAVAREDTGAASAASSAAGQLGSSIGTALLNTIAATATAAYLVTHVGVAQAVHTGAIVHGYTVAAAWGAGILLVLVAPIVWLINAGAPRR